MSALVLGVDAGGSKTVALLADSSGRLLGRGSAGPCNFQSLPEQQVRQALGQAARAAFAAAGLPFQAAAAAGLGIAGVDRPAEITRLERILAEEGLAEKTVIANDSALLLWCGEMQGWGIAVVAGTGSIVFGRTPQGETTRAGGWGYRFGDEGSGYAVGAAALRAVARAADGRGLQTLLTRLVLEHWGLQSPADLIPHIYQNNLPYAAFAQLAPLVSAAAARGDGPAVAILEEAARELAEAAAAVHRRLGFSGKTPAAFGGSLLLKVERVRYGLLRQAALLGAPLEPLALAEEPAAGAVRMALQRLTCS